MRYCASRNRSALWGKSIFDAAAVLRAIGLSRRGVRAMVAWEAAMVGLGAAALGALIGAAYGLVGARLLGVGIGFVPSSTGPLVGLVGGVTVVAVLAALLPAVRAGRVPPVEALRAS